MSARPASKPRSSNEAVESVCCMPRSRVALLAPGFPCGHSGSVYAITLGHGAEVVTIGAAVVSTSTDPCAGCSFEVTLRGPGLVANRTVFMFAFSGIPTYFAELAQSWRGWEGVKAWESPEHDLTIEATFTPGGHDRLRFI